MLSEIYICTMEVFKIPPKKIRITLLKEFSSDGMYYAFLIVILWLSFHFSKFPFLKNIDLSTTVFLSVIVCYYFIRQVMSQYNYYKTYQLLVDGKHITEMYLHNDQASFHVEKAMITDRGNLYFSNGDLRIEVPTIIEKRNILEGLMNPEYIESKEKYIIDIIFRKPLILLITLFISFNIGNSFVMNISAVLLLIMFSIYFIVINRSKNLNASEKRIQWFFLMGIFWITIIWVASLPK